MDARTFAEDRWRQALEQERLWREDADVHLAKRLDWVERMIWSAIGGLSVLSVVLGGRVAGLLGG